MESINRNESELITLEDSGRREEKGPAMKLIANFGVVGVLERKKSEFWSRLCCLSGGDDDEVIDMNVPVQNLNRRLHIVVECKNTKINVRLQPQNEKKSMKQEGRVDGKRALSSMGPNKSAPDGSSCSTVFSVPFPDLASGLVINCGDTRNFGVGASARKRTSSI